MAAIFRSEERSSRVIALVINTFPRFCSLILVPASCAINLSGFFRLTGFLFADRFNCEQRIINSCHLICYMDGRHIDICYVPCLPNSKHDSNREQGKNITYTHTGKKGLEARSCDASGSKHRFRFQATPQNSVYAGLVFSLKRLFFLSFSFSSLEATRITRAAAVLQKRKLGTGEETGCFVTES